MGQIIFFVRTRVREAAGVFPLTVLESSGRLVPKEGLKVFRPHFIDISSRTVHNLMVFFFSPNMVNGCFF